MKNVMSFLIALAVTLIFISSGQAEDKVKSLDDLTCTAGETAKSTGTEWACESDVPRFLDNGDGTVTDNKTGLMWEKKTGTIGTAVNCSTYTDCPDPHDVNNRYTWSSTVGGTDPDGTLYTNFTSKLNDLWDPWDGSTTTCFAGYCDWRIPTIGELRGILISKTVCASNPCIDPIFGVTNDIYWSATTGVPTAIYPEPNPWSAWCAIFSSGYFGDITFCTKYSTGPSYFGRNVRAVRGGGR